MTEMHSFEQRKFQRFSAERPVSFDFAYDFESAVAVEPLTVDGASLPMVKYNAVTKNVSLEGLCFRSEHELRRGDLLNLEVFIPGDHRPVRLLGEVRWTFPAQLEESAVGPRFESGVVLRTIEGKGVRETIRFDEDYHVYWSDVLESILGRFRVLQEQKSLPK